jgi:phosphoribosylaminoimidazole carboxylase
MMALEAPRLNIVMSFLDVDGPTCPAAQVVPSSHMYQGTLHDAAKIRQLVQEQQLDVLTVEIEHVGVETLLELEEQEGVNVQPSGRVLQIIRDKYLQKQHLVQHSIPTAPFVATSSVADIQQAAQQLGLPLMLKSRRGGYDGRGNAVLKLNTEQAILDALWTLDAGATDPLDLYAEGWIDHLCEISVLVVQSTNANMPSISYPPVTTIQQDSVCRVVLAPAPNLSEHLSLECQRVAQQAIQALASPASSSSDTSITPAAGIYGVELFVTRDHQVLVNEIAPRPHNTGHFTQDACHVNQFENHLRAISGLPLGSTDLKVEAAASKLTR